MRDDGSGSGGGVTDGESWEQVEGTGENKYNSRVCSGSQGFIWVGYWGTGGRQYVQSALGRKIYVLAGNGKAEVAYHGVIHHPQQCLIHRVRHFYHQQAAPLDWSAGDRQLQCKLGGFRGNHKREVDHGGPIHSWNWSVETVVGEGVLGSGGGTEGY